MHSIPFTYNNKRMFNNATQVLKILRKRSDSSDTTDSFYTYLKHAFNFSEFKKGGLFIFSTLWFCVIYVNIKIIHLILR